MFLGRPNKECTFGRMIVLGKAFGVTETRLRQLFEECLERDFLQREKQDQTKVRHFLTSTKKEN